MPTVLRLILLLGEVIGFLAFSIVRMVSISKKQKMKKLSEVDKKIFFVFYIISNAIMIISLLFVFPSLIFLSYNKIMVTSVFLVLLLIICVGGIISENNENQNKRKYDHGMFMMLIGFIAGVAWLFTILVASIFSIFNTDNTLLQIKECIEESDSNYITYQIDDKIGITIDSSGKISTYNFLYHDDSNNWYYLDEYIDKTKELKTDEKSYVEKRVITRVIVNKELYTSNEQYITEEKDIYYKLYYNPNDLVKLKSD